MVTDYCLSFRPDSLVQKGRPEAARVCFDPGDPDTVNKVSQVGWGLPLFIKGVKASWGERKKQTTGGLPSFRLFQGLDLLKDS